MLNSGLLEKIIERRKNHFLYEYTKLASKLTKKFTKLASKLTMTSGMSDIMWHKTDKGRLSCACISLQYTVMVFKSPTCLKSNDRDKRRAGLSSRLTSSAVAANWAGPGWNNLLCVKLLEGRAAASPGLPVSAGRMHTRDQTREGRDGRQTKTAHGKRSPCQEQQTQYCAYDGDTSRKQDLIQFLEN